MYTKEFSKLSRELKSADNGMLAQWAADGGWRKSMLDAAKSEDTPSFISAPITHFFAAVFRILPPVGARFRRALVAQAILDGKAAHW